MSSSAAFHRALRRHALPYVADMVYLLLMTFGGEAPSAVPTPQKRGPWRPPRMGRQGRLPNLTASLRRAIPMNHLPYRYIVNTESWILGTLHYRKRKTRLIIVRAIAPTVGGGAAAAAGMAMAGAVAPLRDGRAATALFYCLADAANLAAAYRPSCKGKVHITAGNITGPFTPLHTELLMLSKTPYDQILWGPTPLKTGRNSSPGWEAGAAGT